MLLITADNRFQQCLGRIDDHQLVMTAASAFQESVKGIVEMRHDLRSFRVASVDSEGKRFLCSSKRHFGLLLQSKIGFRKLYFLTYEQMLSAVELLILKGQKFKDRAAQYRVVGQLPGHIILERKIV